MKKFFTPLVIAMVAMPAFAEPYLSFSPPAGKVNMEYFPDGLSNFEMTSSEPITINREADGFITLSLNGTPVKEIPASNFRDLYTFYGFDKTDSGDLHVTFFPHQQTSPFRYLGEYTVTVPAGFLKYADGSTNEEIIIDYTITTPAYNISPDSGEKIESISHAEIFFNDIESLSINSSLSESDLSSLYVAFTSQGGAEEANFPIDIKDITVDGSNVDIKFPQTFDAAGTVEINVPAGLFLVTSTTGLDGSNSEIVASWTTGHISDTEVSYTISPEPGTYQSFTSEYFENAQKYAFFCVHMPEDVKISGFPSMQHPLLAPVSGGITDIQNPFFSFSTAAVVDDNALYIYNGAWNKEINSFAYRTEGTLTPPPGEYRLYIPENTFRLSDGSHNLPLEFPFTIEPSDNGAAYNISPDPLQTIPTPLTSICIDFPSASEIQWANGQYVTITDGIAEYVIKPETAYPDNGIGASLKITLPGSGITRPGVYTLSLPASALLVDSEPTAVNSTLYIGVDAPPVTGVDTVNVAVNESDAYTISGHRADPDRFSNGIYIIGGKKILKK